MELHRSKLIGVCGSCALLLIFIQAAHSARPILIRPENGSATLIPGQAVTLQCKVEGDKRANFWWYKRDIMSGEETLIEPGNDAFELLNNRLIILKPNYRQVADYLCKAIDDSREVSIAGEVGIFRVRMMTYIEDFGLETSHTGASTILMEGDRLELTCLVRNTDVDVKLTWYKSSTIEDDKNMVVIPDTSEEKLKELRAMKQSQMTWEIPKHNSDENPLEQTVTAAETSIIVEKLSLHSKRLIIESVKPEDRSYYICIADNSVTEPTRKIILIRVKDKLIALWPFLGILAELFILFTIIYVWETQRAYKEMQVQSKERSEEGRRLRSG